MVCIKGSNRQPIEITRGDSEIFQVSIEINGEEYIPQEGDVVSFAMRKNFGRVLLQKEVPISTMQLVLDPEDTKYLPFGRYKYDMQITFADGRVKTFVKPSPFIIGEEVN